MRFLICCLGSLLWCEANCAVIPGVANWGAYASLLEGKSIGIVANQTSVAGNQHSVDFLREHGVHIVRVFSPEHGFRGDADAGESVGDAVDMATGLPVVSLYGKKKKPLPEDLRDIETMVFDMQDVGVRFYTYLSTLHYVLEACAEQDIPVVVLDRPCPNAYYVDGPVLQEGFTSFIGMHPVPIVYGMTIGEYACMINGEGWLDCDVKCRLKVIPCQGWERSMTLPLPVRPSPNLPDSISVMLYPSVCLFEGTVVSEGRGTDTPFQVFGHPDLKNMPYTFTPRSIPGMSRYPKCMGELCHGMDLRQKYEEVKKGRRLRLDWLLAAYRYYSGKAPFFTPFFDKLAGNDRLRKDIESGKSEEEIRASWQPALNKFMKIRAKYLIY